MATVTEEKVRAVTPPVGIDADILEKTITALEVRPMTVKELNNVTKYGDDKTLDYVNYLIKKGAVKRNSPNNNFVYYTLTDHEYNIDLSENAKISSIPEHMFREIPIIQHWFEMRSHYPAQKQAVKDFQNVCYGRTVPGFSIHPAKWKYPETNEALFKAWVKAHPDNPALPTNVIKAIRAFIMFCLKVNIPPKSPQAQYLGISVNNHEAGKYRYVKLTSEEFQKAAEFLDGPVAKELCIKVNFEQDRLKAHFAFATEGFGRPSRVLTIESEKVARRIEENGRALLEWRQYESKQGREYPKMLKDQKLYQWATKWLDIRLFANKKFLFVDDNKYVPQKFDSRKPQLLNERAKYTMIYKEMFKAIGKLKEIDSIYNQDTLYSLRHIGVKRWVDRLGFAGVVVIKEMGWEDMNTLLKFYAGLEAVDVRNFIMSGNYRGTDFDIK